MRALVTRPRPDADATAARLAGRGHTALVAPLMTVAPVDWTMPDGPVAALAATSAGAVRALEGDRRLPMLRALPVFAVGPRTASALREAGFAAVDAAAGDVTSLARVIVAARAATQGTILHLAGREVAGDLVGVLSAAGLAAQRVTVYEAVPERSLPPPAAAALDSGTLDVALAYSPRSAALVTALAAAAGLARQVRELPFACLSAVVAEPLRAAGVLTIGVARTPDEEALFAAMEAMRPEGRVATDDAKRV